MALSPRADLAVAGDHEGRLRFFDVVSGRRVADLFAHDGAVRSLAFGPDGSRVVSSGDDGVVRLWDLDALGILGTGADLASRVWRATGYRTAGSEAVQVTNRLCPPRQGD